MKIKNLIIPVLLALSILLNYFLFNSNIRLRNQYNDDIFKKLDIDPKSRYDEIKNIDSDDIVFLENLDKTNDELYIVDTYGALMVRETTIPNNYITYMTFCKVNDKRIIVFESNDPNQPGVFYDDGEHLFCKTDNNFAVTSSMFSDTFESYWDGVVFDQNQHFVSIGLNTDNSIDGLFLTLIDNVMCEYHLIDGEIISLYVYEKDKDGEPSLFSIYEFYRGKCPEIPEEVINQLTLIKND